MVKGMVYLTLPIITQYSLHRSEFCRLRTLLASLIFGICAAPLDAHLSWSAAGRLIFYDLRTEEEAGEWFYVSSAKTQALLSFKEFWCQIVA